MSDDMIYAADVKRAGYCMKGARAWFERHEGLDFNDFVRNGIKVSDVPADDAVVQHVLKVKAQNG